MHIDKATNGRLSKELGRLMRKHFEDFEGDHETIMELARAAHERAIARGETLQESGTIKHTVICSLDRVKTHTYTYTFAFRPTSRVEARFFQGVDRKNNRKVLDHRFIVFDNGESADDDIERFSTFESPIEMHVFLEKIKAASDDYNVETIMDLNYFRDVEKVGAAV